MLLLDLLRLSTTERQIYTETSLQVFDFAIAYLKVHTTINQSFLRLHKTCFTNPFSKILFVIAAGYIRTGGSTA